MIFEPFKQIIGYRVVKHGMTDYFTSLQFYQHINRRFWQSL